MESLLWLMLALAWAFWALLAVQVWLFQRERDHARTEADRQRRRQLDDSFLTTPNLRLHNPAAPPSPFSWPGE